MQPKVLLLVSGRLGEIVLDFLFEKIEIVAVFTDYKSIEIINFCNENDILIFKGNPRNQRSIEFVQKLSFDIILSVNYLFIINKELLQTPTKYAINIHGSLLPKYRGRTPHVWAIINGEKQVGITAHIMTEELDAGDIIDQIIIPITEVDTGYTVLKYFEKTYPVLIDKLLNNINSFNLKPQCAEEATVFPKREPQDGRINWQWHKERIFNWIRALSKPYPGSFCFYGKNKIIIHKSKISNSGFDFMQKNGTILKVFPESLVIKVSNGAIEIFDIENFKSFNFVVNKILT